MANQFTQNYTTYIDTWRRNMDPQRDFAAQQYMAGKGSSGGGSDTLQTLKMVTELQKIKKARSGATVSPAAVLQALMKLQDTRTQALVEDKAQISKLAKDYIDASDKNRAMLDWRTETPHATKWFTNNVTAVEQGVKRQTTPNYADTWLKRAQGVTADKTLKAKNQATKDALLKDIALQAKAAANEDSRHMEGYNAIVKEFFNGREPEEYIASTYPVFDTKTARDMATRAVNPGIESLDEEIESMRVVANREFGYPLAKGQKVTPDMLAQAKVGQADEIDKLISELITKSMGGQNMPGYAGQGARTNMAQMILGNALAMPPMIGAAAIGASPRVMRMALESEREMAKYQRERIAFEDKYGYAPGTRRFEDTPTPPPVQQMPIKPVTVGTILPGEDEFGGNFYSYMSDQLGQASSLVASKDAADQSEGVGIFTGLFEQIDAFPPSAQEMIAIGMGYPSYEKLNEARSETMKPDEWKVFVDEAIKDPKRYEFGEVGAIYEEFLNKIETDDPNNPETYVKNVQGLRQFIAVLPEEVRGEYGDNLLRQINESFERMRATKPGTAERNDSFDGLKGALGSYREEVEEDFEQGPERRKMAQTFRSEILQEPTPEPAPPPPSSLDAFDPKDLEPLELRLEDLQTRRDTLVKSFAPDETLAKEKREIEETLASLRESLTAQGRNVEARQLLKEREAALKADETKLAKIKNVIRAQKAGHEKVIAARGGEGTFEAMAQSDEAIEKLRQKRDKDADTTKTLEAQYGRYRDMFVETLGEEDSDLKAKMQGAEFDRQIRTGELDPRFRDFLQSPPESDVDMNDPFGIPEEVDQDIVTRYLASRARDQQNDGKLGEAMAAFKAEFPEEQWNREDSEFEKVIEEHAKLAAPLEKEIAAQKGLVERLRAKVESLPQPTPDIQSQIDVKNRQLQALNASVRGRAKQLDTVNQQIAKLTQQIEGLSKPAASAPVAAATPPVDTSAVDAAIRGL